MRISKIVEISSPDKLRLANKLDMSKLSTSKLFTKPDISISFKSILNNSNIGAKADMSNSESFKIAIISENVIADKS